MKSAIAAAAFGALALFGLAGASAARADAIDVYRTDHDGPYCRVVETQTINRWGNEVTIRQHICSSG
jgi:hypothetical protein